MPDADIADFARRFTTILQETERKAAEVRARLEEDGRKSGRVVPAPFLQERRRPAVLQERVENERKLAEAVGIMNGIASHMAGIAKRTDENLQEMRDLVGGVGPLAPEVSKLRVDIMDDWTACKPSRPRSGPKWTRRLNS